MSDFLLIMGASLAAGIASPVGGLFALWRRPTTFFTSIVVGFAAGVLIATIGFEMMPKALKLGSLPTAVLGFLAGLAGVYAFDFFIHRGRIAGEKAEQHRPWPRAF